MQRIDLLTHQGTLQVATLTHGRKSACSIVTSIHQKVVIMLAHKQINVLVANLGSHSLPKRKEDWQKFVVAERVGK